MSGFIANGAPPSELEEQLENDGFFPDIDLVLLRKTLRLDGSVTSDRLEQAAIAAVMSTNRDLASLPEKHSDKATLAEVPATALAGKSILVHLYHRAIYCAVGAEVAERYRSYDSTGAGNSRADDLTPSIDEYRRDARYAIRDMLGQVRTTVELI